MTTNHHDPTDPEPANTFPPLPVSQPLPTFPTGRVFVAPVGTPPPPPPPYMPFVERLQWSDIGVADVLAVTRSIPTHNDDSEETHE